jgi:hypothetical protein
LVQWALQGGRHLDLTAENRAALANVATLKEIASPAGAPERLPPLARQPDERLWGSLALTKMREEMSAVIDARVVLRGRLSGQQGLYPGVAEEALLALAVGVPLYVAGGFGGCGRAVASALGGATPSELGLEYQEEHTPGYRELAEVAASTDRAPSFEEMIRIFAMAGIGGLGNGLETKTRICACSPPTKWTKLSRSSSTGCAV